MRNAIYLMATTEPAVPKLVLVKTRPSTLQPAPESCSSGSALRQSDPSRPSVRPSSWVRDKGRDLNPVIVRPSSSRVAVKAGEVRVDIGEMPGRLLRQVPLPPTRDLVSDPSASWRADDVVRGAHCSGRLAMVRHFHRQCHGSFDESIHDVRL